MNSFSIGDDLAAGRICPPVKVPICFRGGELTPFSFGAAPAGGEFSPPVKVPIGVPFGLLGRALVRGEVRLDIRTKHASSAGATPPSFQILAVEKTGEAGRS